MVPLLFEHPVEWWHGLSGAEQLALLAVAIGACTVLVTTWLGVRKWWLRWKREQTDEDVPKEDER